MARSVSKSMDRTDWKKLARDALIWGLPQAANYALGIGGPVWVGGLLSAFIMAGWRYLKQEAK